MSYLGVLLWHQNPRNTADRNTIFTRRMNEESGRLYRHRVYFWVCFLNEHKLCVFLLIKKEKQMRGENKKVKKTAVKKLYKTPTPPPWFCLGALLSKFFCRLKVLTFLSFQFYQLTSMRRDLSALVARPEGSPSSCATTRWLSAWCPAGLGAAGGKGVSSGRLFGRLFNFFNQ